MMGVTGILVAILLSATVSVALGSPTYPYDSRLGFEAEEQQRPLAAYQEVEQQQRPYNMMQQFGQYQEAELQQRQPYNNMMQQFGQYQEAKQQQESFNLMHQVEQGSMEEL